MKGWSSYAGRARASSANGARATLTTMTEPQLHPELDGVHNFREVAPYPLRGGGRLRPGMIYRAGGLELMSEGDVAYLGEELGVATILDLRHPDEGAPSDHPLASRVAHISVFSEENTQQGLIDELNGLYGMGPSPERYLHYLLAGGDRWLRAMRLFADESAYPVLIHCTAGKDRTGVLVGMIMDILGAGDEDIAEEYGLSSASVDRLIAYLESTGRTLEGTREEIVARLITPPERMAGFIRLMREKYGSAEAYLVSQGMSAEEVQRIRELLTGS